MPDDILPEAMEAALRLSRETTLFDDYRGTLTIGDIATLIQSYTRLKELREIAEEMAHVPYCKPGCGAGHVDGNLDGPVVAWHGPECPVTRLAALRKEG